MIIYIYIKKKKKNYAGNLFHPISLLKKVYSFCPFEGFCFLILYFIIYSLSQYFDPVNLWRQVLLLHFVKYSLL